MAIVRVVFKNKDVRYISEEYPYRKKIFRIHTDINKALSYSSRYEFMVAFKLINSETFRNKQYGYFLEEDEFYGEPSRLKSHSYDKIRRIECIDDNETKIKKLYLDDSFNIKGDIKVEDTKFFSHENFKLLTKCGITSSHWTYVDEDWLAFPKKEDSGKITRIDYYKRGLIYMFYSIFLYRNYSVPSCYESLSDQKPLLYNEWLQKIYLSDLDICHRFHIKLIK